VETELINTQNGFEIIIPEVVVFLS